MHDRVWAAIERELKGTEPVDDAAVERIVREVRLHRPGAARRLWGWLTRPRLVRAAPLWAMGGAAAVLAALWLAVAPASAPPAPGAAGAEPPAPAAHPVQFVLVAPEAARVSLAGDFNDWDRDATPLRRTGGNGVWSVVVPLPNGRYRYVFIVDGERWIADAAAARGPEDDFGPSSVVLVGEGT
ncbi:MAG: isoamylase early set domain-containing protein [Longimicrobiaceae bacterium]